jgi:hypothetical protein
MTIYVISSGTNQITWDSSTGKPPPSFDERGDENDLLTLEILSDAERTWSWHPEVAAIPLDWTNEPLALGAMREAMGMAHLSRASVSPPSPDLW